MEVAANFQVQIAITHVLLDKRTVRLTAETLDAIETALAAGSV